MALEILEKSGRVKRGKEDGWLRSLRYKNDEKLVCRKTTRL